MIERDSAHLVPFTGYLTICLYASILLITAVRFAFITKVPVSETVRKFTLYL